MFDPAVPIENHDDQSLMQAAARAIEGSYGFGPIDRVRLIAELWKRGCNGPVRLFTTAEQLDSLTALGRAHLERTGEMPRTNSIPEEPTSE